MDDIVSPAAIERANRHSVIDLPGHGDEDRDETSATSDAVPPLTAVRDDALVGAGQGPAQDETVAPTVPPTRARAGRFFLLAGVAVFVVAGGAAGYTYRGPLMAAVHRFELQHGLLGTDHSAEIHPPRPIQPAQRLASKTVHNPAFHSATVPNPSTPARPPPGRHSLAPARPDAGSAVAKPPNVTAQRNPAAAEIDALKGGAGPVEPAGAMRPTPGSTPPAAHANPPAAVAAAPDKAQPASATSGSATPGAPVPAVSAATPSAASSPGAHAGPVAPSQLVHPAQVPSPTRAAAAPTAQPASARPGNPATLAAVPRPVETAQKLVAAPMTPRAQVDVLSLVSQLGLVVAELRTQNDQLAAKVQAMHRDMTSELAGFDRRLTFDQAHDRLALAGAAKPDVHPPANQTAGVFPAPPAKPLEHLKPSSYRIEAASPSLAILSHDGQSLEVSVGSNVPGVGQVVAIRQYGPDWRIVTAHGVIR